MRRVLETVTGAAKHLGRIRGEKSATPLRFGTLALALASLVVSCSSTPPPEDPSKSRTTHAKPTAKDDGLCHCVSTDEEDACDCPHCAGMNAGFEPGKCPCASRGR